MRLHEEFGLSVSDDTIYRALHKLGFSHLSARLRAYKQDPDAIAAFKNVWPAPSARDLFEVSLRQRIRPHMRALASSYFISTRLRFRRIGAIESIDQGGAPITTGLPCKPHIRRDRVPTTVPHSGRESSRRAAPLFETMRGIRPDNGDAPLDPSAPAVVRLGLSLSFRMD
jgi:hypothetical protein